MNRWKVQNLDYNWYFALTIVGGYFGLDYLYLGSPIGAFTKMMINLSTFGYWWFYDALNAVVGQDEVRLYGPTAPALGAIGIAAARFRDPKNPSVDPALDKHLNFLLYGLVLGFFGMFGGDSFLTGHFFNGVIRLFCMISMIGVPIAIFWWIKNLYYYVFDTSTCINQNYAYFGAPKGTGPECPSFLMSLVIFVLKTASGILGVVPGFGPLVKIIVDRLIESLMVAYDMVTVEVEETVVNTVKLASAAAKMPINPEELLAAKEKLLASGPALAKGMRGGFEQEGGGSLPADNSFLPLFLSMTLGLIIVSSIVISLRRLKQNAKPASEHSKTARQYGNQETDEPPQPGDSRGPTPV